MPTAYLEEVNPWEAQVARSDLAAQKLSLDDGLWKILREPNREIIVHIPVQLDDGRLETFTGFRVQHSIDRGPAKGGVRYSPNVTLDETRALADVEPRQRVARQPAEREPPPGPLGTVHPAVPGHVGTVLRQLDERQTGQVAQP